MHFLHQWACGARAKPTRRGGTQGETHGDGDRHMPIHHTDEFLHTCRRQFETELARARERARTIGDGDTDPVDVTAGLERAQALLRQMNGLLSDAALQAWHRRYVQAVEAIEGCLGTAARPH
jgi:hypothetical protein